MLNLKAGRPSTRGGRLPPAYSLALKSRIAWLSRAYWVALKRRNIQESSDTLPTGAKVVATATKGGWHSLAPKARLYGFSCPQGGCIGFIVPPRSGWEGGGASHQRGPPFLAPAGRLYGFPSHQLLAAGHIPDPGPSPLRTFGPKGRHPSAAPAAVPIICFTSSTG